MSKNPPSCSSLDAFHALNDLWSEIDPQSGGAGIALHEDLFGAEGKHSILLAFGKRREEYQKSILGPVREIADLAVTSGHEAVACFAERVGGFARVRRSELSRLRQALTDAKDRQDPVAVAKAEHAIAQFGTAFGKTIQTAFMGWEEHRAWIQRSIRQEQVTHPQLVDALLHMDADSVHTELAELPGDALAMQPEVDWAQVEADIKDPEFRTFVHGVIERHKKTGHPLAAEILDGIRNRENHDNEIGELQQIVRQQGTDALAACRRWRSLTSWGLRRLTRASHGGHEVVSFKDAAMAENLNGNMGTPASPALRWARAMKEATHALLPLTRAAEFDTAGTKPIHVLVREMDYVLSGKEIDLHQPVSDVGLIVAEIESRQDPLARWHAIRADWGQPRDERGRRPVLIDWQNWPSMETAVQLAGALDELLPEARAANPSHALVLLDMIKKLHDGAFLTTNGREPFIALLQRVDLIIADIEVVRRENARRPATPPDLTRHAEQFEQFAKELMECRKGLRDNASNLHLVAETRTLLASAGAVLVELVQQNAIATPDPTPPWLAWLTSGTNPQFGKLKYGQVIYSGGDGTLSYMLKQVGASLSLDKQAVHSLEGPDNRSLHYRHIFLEAVATWAGSRCTPPVQLQLPTGSVVVDGTEVGFVADWAGDTVDQASLMRDIGRAAETVCRDLARLLGHVDVAATHSNQAQRAPHEEALPRPPVIRPNPEPTPAPASADVAGTSKEPAAPTPEIVANMLIREGKTWRITFNANSATLPDRIGLGYLQKLVATPHRAVDVHELKGVTRIIESRQLTIDPKTRREMQRDYDDAEAKVMEAEENNDVEGAEAARDKLRNLAARIPTPGAQERALPSEAERIRTSVAKALKHALKEIDDVHPEAHAHLKQFLVAPTSSSPCYDPRPTSVWQVNPTAVPSHYQQVNPIDS